MQRLRATATLVSLACLGFALGCGSEPASPPLPGSALRARVEARLQSERGELRESIGHYALVYEVKPRELHRFMTQIYPRREGADIVLGGLDGIELHGGGVLEILARLWRPNGRSARLSDAYPFASSRGAVPLQDLYDSLRSQLFVPVPDVDAEEIDGRLPETPTLARTRMPHRTDGRPAVAELDAFNALALFLRYEEDLDRSWTNRQGQKLSTRILLDAAWHYSLLPRSAEQEFSDHGHLHLVEILLAYNRRLPPEQRRDSNALKQRLLATEFERHDYGPLEPSEAWGHAAEALGLLLAEPEVHWSSEDRARVRAWLAELETVRLAEIDNVPLQHLAHLQRGLALIEAHADRLQ